MPGRDVRILETTVRDGGYEIDHNWGLEDVAALVSLLDAAGFTYLSRLAASNRPRCRVKLAAGPAT
ncbi:MAG TPA: hypothetical protein VKB80_18285 [Kofleriaceae bacterium]|nr:hypothetical protein [Kofleriaceae bacterium]